MTYIIKILCWLGIHTRIKTVYDEMGMIRWCDHCSKVLEVDW